MAATISNLNLQLSLSSRGLTSGLNQAKSEVSSFAGTMTAIGSMTSGFGIALGLMASAASTATSAVSSLAQAVIYGATEAVKAAADYESLQIAFEVMTGSAEKAQSILGQLSAFAAATPFTMATLVPVTQQMMSYGFSAEQALGLIARLGDIAAASPRGMEFAMERITVAIGQIRGAGKVMGTEMRQLTEAGVPAWEALAKKLGTDVGGAMAAVTAGSVDALTGISAIIDLAESPKFAGMMARQSQSLKGLWSTFIDNFQVALRGTGKVLVDVLGLKDVTRNMGDLMAAATAAFAPWQPWLAVVGAGFSTLREIAVTGLMEILQGIGAMGQGLAGQVPTLTEVRTAVLDFVQATGKGLIALGPTFAKLGDWVLYFGKLFVSVVGNNLELLEFLAKTARDHFGLAGFGDIADGLDAARKKSREFARGIGDLQQQMRATLTEDFFAGMGAGFDNFITRVREGAGFWASAFKFMEDSAKAALKPALDLGAMAAQKAAAVQFAGAAEQGSKDAYSAILRHQAGQGQEQVPQKLDRLAELQKANLMEMKNAVDVLRKMVLPLGVQLP